VIGKLAPAFGVLGAIILYAKGHPWWFGFSLVCIVSSVAASWWLAAAARKRYALRIARLRGRLLYSRTLEKRLEGNSAVDPIEKDDVDVLVGRILRRTLDTVPSWAICDIREINDVRAMVESCPNGLDPDAQALWLTIVYAVVLLGCVICGLVLEQA